MLPTRVEKLQHCFWNGNTINRELPSLQGVKERVNECIGQLREDHQRALNPTPYKVSVTEALYHFLHRIWLKNAPVGQLN